MPELLEPVETNERSLHDQSLAMPAYARARALTENKFVWLAPLMLVVACSGSEDTNFFEPRSGGGTAPGGSGGTVGGTDGGGSAGGGTTSVGGTSGDTNGGTAGQSGGTDAMGGSDPQGGSSAGDGMGGTPVAGMAGQGGDAGSNKGGDAGMAGAGMGGTPAAGMGGGGMSGAGMAGAGMGGAGMAGGGVGGSGKGGKGGAGGSAGCTPTTPSTERCDGVDNNCMGGIDEGMTCPAGCTGATRAGHYYLFCSFEADMGGSGTRFRTWTQAQDFCSDRSTSLVFIESAEENAFIREWITRMMLEDQVWMGANDRDPTLGSNEGEWVWGTANNATQFWDGDENGDPVMNRYSNWASGEPNNQGNEDCGVLSSNHDYQWDDRVCTNQYLNFVCESTAAVTAN